MTQGWKIPDGAPCSREGKGNQNRYCFNGECRFFDCDGHSTEFPTEQCTTEGKLSKAVLKKNVHFN